MKSQKRNILSGVFWNSLQVLINKSFGFMIKLVLARILLPEEFGLVGMAVVFTSFIEVFNDLGFGAALIQRKEEEVKATHFNTAFWTGVIWSLIIFQLMVFVISPLAAKFYDEPILTEIIPVLSLGILSSPINLVHKAKLLRALDFKRAAFIENAASISSGILSLILAFSGAGVWSLVFNSLATFLIAVPLYFRATRWIPSFEWSKAAFKDIFGFGIYTTGTNLVNNLINKADYLLIGKLLSASALGAYTLAFVLTDTFRSQLMSIMNKVMYPIYGKTQDDKGSMKRYYLNVVKYNSLLINPIMGLLFVLARPIVLNFFGTKWEATILPLQIISLSVIFHMMVNSNTVLIRGMGKPKLEFMIQFLKSIFVFLPAISVGIYYFGIVGGAYAVLFNKIASVFIAQIYLKKLVDINILDLFASLKVTLSCLFVSITSGIILYNVLNVNYMIVGLLMTLLYFGGVWLMMGNELKEQYFEIKLRKSLTYK
ncbi:lipopolysaccharide biosynthesis protein [Algoriphagus halophytocola]|uniref:Lipopolysaccharide biosynthesis protein n=1 Tax=Algoriphagus halophytocola TaxID=2991499 RepID=A0ABY6MGW3_9BACT|nr:MULTISPECIES: lipopolysaccharide biosynthesis protein [unclassified Algoriphagus]UZD23031.1 lipopolysaccharide biosynthesis protein [Algoriphagus sp. TR-M5]WBL44323.1 lipopolysaccharide biosynthesis protein [Algoriphagus sp. TR-M9]